LRSRRSISTTVLAIIIIVIVVVVAVGAYAAYMLTRKPAPKYITIGVVYDSTGSFATSSMPEYEGLELWANWVNSHGGIYVKEYGKNLTVKIIALDAGSTRRRPSATTSSW